MSDAGRPRRGGIPERWRPRIPNPPSLLRRPGTPPPALEDEQVARDIESVIGDCAIYEAAGRRPGRMPFAEAAAAARAGEGFVWVGMQQPTAAEVETVAHAFGLPPLAVEDAIAAHQRPKLEVHDDVLFAVLKPVRYLETGQFVDVAEIAIFVGQHFVVTVRHGESDVLTRVRRELDAAGDSALRHGPAVVLYRAADLVVDEYEDVVDSISIEVEDIEAQVFGGDENDHAERIYKLKREVLQFRRAVLPLADPMDRLAHGQVPWVPEDAKQYFRDVHDHLLRAADAIEAHDRMLTDVLTADLAQVSVRQNRTAVRQNEDMRKISAWAAIALVPTAIAGIYGMNFDNMPELHAEHGYFVIVGIMAAICVTLYALFRKNGWL